ncbi:hypothetical protein DV735_g770, partial [Chaetothyriales sp. CBS 134920]
MGGNAFTRDDASLSFPRMSPQMYEQLKDELTARLLRHFEYVQVPIEAPEKTSYGDIDVLVCNPLNPDVCDAASLSSALCARMWKQPKGSDTVNLAFEWPEEEGVDVPCQQESPPDSDTPSTDSQSGVSTKGCMFQVDVHMCDSAKTFQWELFSLTHGDLWVVLGSIIRPFGLVRNHLGLLVAIHEIEKFVEAVGGVGGVPKHLGRVLVTDDPSSTLGFLGLDAERYWKPFESVGQMFDYAATCRFYIARGKRAQGEGQGEETGEEQSSRQGKSTYETCHRVRRQINRRDVLQRWLTEYKPTHPARPSDPPDTETPNLAQPLDAVQAAKSFFGASFTTRYNTALNRTLFIFGARHLWANIRRLLTTQEGAKGDELGYATKGLKRCVQPAGFEAWAQAVLLRGEPFPSVRV